MDQKTLEYMKTRVEMAEALTKKINDLKDALAKVQELEIEGLELRFKVTRENPTSYKQLWHKSTDFYKSIALHVEEALEEEIAKLQKYLDEL